MRIPVLAAALAACLTAAEPPPPAGAQKLLDEAVVATSKARQTFAAAAKKEQDKLVAALTKEQEKETKKGNLDGAMAIKALIEQVQEGLVLQKSEEAADLLGDGAKPTPPPPGTAASLLTDCPAALETPRAEGVPKALEPVLARCSGISIAKGDKTRYNFTVTSPGTVVVLTGSSERNHGDIWPVLLEAGFKRIEGLPWFTLDAKPGMKFTVWDPPMAAAQVQVFAAKFKVAR